MLYDTFKEARKAAREYKTRKAYVYLGKIKKGDGKGKFRISENSFSEAEFLVNKDGRVCKISDIKKGKDYPFPFQIRNRKPGEDKQEYLKNMAIKKG